MLLVISPAKTLDFDTPATTGINTEAALLLESEKLIKQLQTLAPQDIAGLMKLSDKLADLNYQRFQDWQLPLPEPQAKQAVLAFKGDVYTGLDAETLSTGELRFAQQHLRILSGLYGVLRPLDKILAYRLEMGTNLSCGSAKNLYDFWGDKITEQLNAQLKKIKSQTLVNLASNEYFKAVNTEVLKANIVTPVFKDWKSGKYKIISFYAKKARGLMSAYAIKNAITDAKALKKFTVAGYAFDKDSSTADQWVFLRKENE